MRVPAITVTDHALLRYLERAQGEDFREVRARLAQFGGLAVHYGASSIIVDGVRLLIRDGAIVTVLDRSMQPSSIESYLGRPFGAAGRP